MNICVCVKQVPDTTEIKIDPVTNTLIRDGVPSIVNTYDTYALENAARIKDADKETKIVVITMGPEQAKTALKECLAIAADKAYLITDKAFGGSDTLATSYILSKAIRKIEETEGQFDCIFCGKQAIDGDTGQVGPELAEHLGYPQITCAIEAKLSGGRLQAIQQGPENKEVLETSFPCVITFTQPDFEVRYPTVRRKMAANRAQIPGVTSMDLSELDLSCCGLKGSPTRVKKTYVPVRNKNGLLIKEETPEESSRKLAELLSEAHIL